MNDIAIEVSHVWKKFRRGELHDSLRDFIPSIIRHFKIGRNREYQLAEQDFWALQDVSFQLKRGEALGIIGPNGAGKSTILKLLSRILRPNKGYIRVNGRLSALIEVAAGFHPDLTGRENIYLNGAILGIKKTEIDHRMDEIIEFSGIEAFIDTPVKRYSSGMGARLGFSVIAHMNPELLLVDEVLSVGDASFRAKCVQCMTNLLRSSDVSVIFISHNLDQVRQLCDRCIVLDKGIIEFMGDVENAINKYFECLQFKDDKYLDKISKNATGAAGRIIGLGTYDHEGQPSAKIAPYCKTTFEIIYELKQKFPSIALTISIQSPNGNIIARCTSANTQHHLPATVGIHKAYVHIDGLPLHAGEYLIGVRLVDFSSNMTLDLQDRRYPILISGTSWSEDPVCLKYEWS